MVAAVCSVCIFNPASNEMAGVVPAGTTAVNNPLPCVKAAIVRSLLLNCNMSTRTFAKPVLVGCQSVLAPFRLSVDHTPNSVAIKAQSEFLGSKIAQRTRISGRFPITLVQVGVPDCAFVDSNIVSVPKLKYVIIT